MSVSHQYTLKLVGAPGATPLIGSPSEVGGTNLGIDTSIAANVTNLPYTIAFVRAGLRAIYLLADKNLTIKVNGTDAVQTLSITGTPTGGTFTCTFGAQTTAAIAYNATFGAVQSALQALSSVGAGGITCTGGPLPGTPVVCTFAGARGLAAQATITCTSASLTGGTTPTASFASTTTGVAPTDTLALVAGDPLIWRASPAYFAIPLTADVVKFSFTTGTAATNLQGYILAP